VAEVDHSDAQRLVQDLRTESANYYRQFVIWLGVGSAGAAISLISLASHLPNPDYSFHKLLPSLLAFILGLLSASFSILLVSFSKSRAAEHFAESHNREQYAQAAQKLPEVLSSPQKVADEMNKERNEFIRKSKISHDRSEMAWGQHIFWKRATNVAVITSAISFVCGLGWPIVFLALGNSLVK
jgi:hypothetical protein